MASTEHCLFCFETLVAQLEKRTPLDFEAVQKAYAAYVAGDADVPDLSSADGPAKQLPALRRLAETLTPASASSSSSMPSTPGSGDSSASASTTSLSKDTAATTPASYASAAASATSLAPTASPLFVTWNTTEDEPAGEHALRGCIGTFEAQPLAEGLATYALTAALGDSRFPPVTRRELPFLETAVTLLTDFEPATGGVFDWTLGTHGLRISFTHHGRRYGATYLPDVAPEQGWTQEETLISLMRKAGWTGRRDRWRDVDVHVVRYQGKKHSLDYAAYKRWRAWVDAHWKE
ncbi:AMMECR1 domain protein [Niveomyces insectorum RCEF 264]|uniref:AMMECR1 domain protein n=1 Tax=Niveomyces insectorum RCEF 264 TaxID=1081102 RepID=A0A167SR90_9HYPO|nr:AMMECR1 domain protein [Niveomyces insectorum RCEF 264]